MVIIPLNFARCTLPCAHRNRQVKGSLRNRSADGRNGTGVPCLNRLWYSPVYFRHYIKCGAGSPVSQDVIEENRSENAWESFFEWFSLLAIKNDALKFNLVQCKIQFDQVS